VADIQGAASNQVNMVLAFVIINKFYYCNYNMPMQVLLCHGPMCTQIFSSLPTLCTSASLKKPIMMPVNNITSVLENKQFDTYLHTYAVNP